MIKQIRIFIINHWQVVLLVGICLFVVVHDIIATNTHLLDNPISIENKVNLLMTMISGFIIDTLIQIRRLKENTQIGTIDRTAIINAFIAELANNIENIRDGVNERQGFKLFNKYESMSMILKLIDSATISYEGLNYYIGGWNSSMEIFYKANISAMHRGVKITRYFVVQKEFDLNDIESVFLEMKKQYEDKINVFYISEKDLNKISFFRNYSLKGTGLYDDNILSFDTAPTKQSDAPIEITITWHKNEVNERNPFPHLRNSNWVYPFNSKTTIERIKKVCL